MYSGIHSFLNISLEKLGFLIADIVNPIPAPTKAPFPVPQFLNVLLMFRYFDIVSPAIANEAAALNGFSALANPHPTVPITEPIAAPLSTLSILLPPPIALIPS